MLPALCFTETWTFAGSELLAGKPDQRANAAGAFKSRFSFSPAARLPSQFGLGVTCLPALPSAGAAGLGCRWSCSGRAALGRAYLVGQVTIAEPVTSNGHWKFKLGGWSGGI